MKTNFWLTADFSKEPFQLLCASPSTPHLQPVSQLLKDYTPHVHIFNNTKVTLDPDLDRPQCSSTVLKGLNLQNLANEVAGLKDSLQKAKLDKAQLEQQRQYLEQKASADITRLQQELRNEKESKTSLVEYMQTQAAELSRDKAILNSQLAEQRSLLQQSQDGQSRLQQKYNIVSLEAFQLRARFKQLQKQIETQRQSHSLNLQRSEVYRLEVLRLKDINAQLIQHIRTEVNKQPNVQLSQEVSRLEQEVSQLKQDLAEARQHAEASSCWAEEAISNLQREMEQAGLRHQRIQLILRQDLRQARLQKEGLQVQLATMRREQDEHYATRGELTASLVRLQSQHEGTAELEQKICELQQQVEGLQADILQTEQRNNWLENALAQTQAELESALVQARLQQGFNRQMELSLCSTEQRLDWTLNRLKWAEKEAEDDRINCEQVARESQLLADKILALSIRDSDYAKTSMQLAEQLKECAELRDQLRQKQQALIQYRLAQLDQDKAKKKPKRGNFGRGDRELEERLRRELAREREAKQQLGRRLSEAETRLMMLELEQREQGRSVLRFMDQELELAQLAMSETN